MEPERYQELLRMRQELSRDYEERQRIYADYRARFTAWLDSNPDLDPNTMKLAIHGLHFPLR